MRFSRRLIFRQAAVLVVFIASTVMGIASPSGAGPASGLCQMDVSRGAVPAAFPIDACLNGSTLYLRNTLSVPLDVLDSGGLGTPSVTPSHPSVADGLTRGVLKNPSNLLLPGDVMSIPYGLPRSQCR